MPREVAVEVGELAVAVAVGMDLAVLEPEQLECHTFSPQLLVDMVPVRSRPGDVRRDDRREEQVLERAVVELVRQRPGEPRGARSLDVVGDGREGNAE